MTIVYKKMKAVYLSAFAAIAATSCGTATFATYGYENSIYTFTEDDRASDQAGNINLESLRKSSMQTIDELRTESQVIASRSQEQEFIPLAEGETFEERLTKFDNPEYSINISVSAYPYGCPAWIGFGYHSPGYWSRWYGSWYDPWYGGWYDPWYNPWYGGWYDPWYNPWYGGWYNPWYGPWYGGWYNPWYDPWYGGWHDPWYPSGSMRDRNVYYGKRNEGTVYGRRNGSLSGEGNGSLNTPHGSSYRRTGNSIYTGRNTGTATGYEMIRGGEKSSSMYRRTSGNGSMMNGSKINESGGSVYRRPSNGTPASVYNGSGKKYNSTGQGSRIEYNGNQRNRPSSPSYNSGGSYRRNSGTTVTRPSAPSRPTAPARNGGGSSYRRR